MQPDAEQAEHLYDSVERRRDLAAGLEGIADAETIEARVLADINQARPASEAVATAPGKTAKAALQHGTAGRSREAEKSCGR